MKESVELSAEPALRRISLTLTGLTFRTFSAVDSDTVWLFEFVHEASPTRSPLNITGPGVTLNVAVTLAPGGTESGKVFAVSVVPETTDFHSLPGTEILSLTAVTGLP